MKHLLIIGFFIFGIWLCGFALFCAYAMRVSGLETPHTQDAIVVLTGGPQRVAAGLDLFAHGKAGHLFISGVHPDVTLADIENQWQGDTALPPCCLSIGHSATTTVENAAEVKDWAAQNDITGIILVTSDYHMLRALFEIEDALPDVAITPYAIKQDDLQAHPLRLWSLLLSEYHKSALRWVQLRLS
ncbi:MAG: YdcF family protein [Bdellovibrionales bacterium]